jgi:hypothetical protein
MANTVIQLRNSTVTGNVPSSLANGEISINSRDGKFFYSTPAGSVITHYPYLGPAGLNKEIQFNDSGTLGANAGLSFDKSSGIFSTKLISVTNSVGDEGGEILLAKPSTNTTLVGTGITIDSFQNKIRFFEQGGSARGAYIDLTECVGGAGTNLLNPTSTPDTTARNTANAAFIQANASFLQANTPSATANSAASYANAAFLAANAATAADTTQNNSITAAFTRANNSLNSNTGGTVTANTTFSGNVFLTGNGTTLSVTSNISFISPNTQNTITARMINGGTLSFSSNSGELFSITDSLATGSIFSVNDISGLPVIDVNANGEISLAQYGGNVHVYNTTTSISNTTGALVVDGGVGVRGNVYADAIYDGGIEIILYANTIFTAANSAGVYANSAFAAANAASTTNLTQNNSITAAFLQANTPSATANSAALYANAAFTRANNSLDANNGGTVTGTITATSFITTGSFGNILGANTIYANNFVANTGFIQFADGSKQYTANAGSGGSGGNSFGQVVANGGTILATTSNDSIQIVGESGITVTSNVSAKKVIVSVPAGFTFTTADYGFVTDSTNVIYDYGTI